MRLKQTLPLKVFRQTGLATIQDVYKRQSLHHVKQVSIHSVKGYKCQIFNFCFQNIQNFVYTFVISIFLITIDIMK